MDEWKDQRGSTTLGAWLIRMGLLSLAFVPFQFGWWELSIGLIIFTSPLIIAPRHAVAHSAMRVLGWATIGVLCLFVLMMGVCSFMG